MYVGPNNTAQISGNAQLTGKDNAAVVVGGELTLSENVTLSGPSGVTSFESGDNEESVQACHVYHERRLCDCNHRDLALAGNNLESAGCDATS